MEEAKRGLLEGRVKQIERSLELKDREKRKRKTMILKGVQKEKED